MIIIHKKRNVYLAKVPTWVESSTITGSKCRCLPCVDFKKFHGLFDLRYFSQNADIMGHKAKKG